MSIVTPTVLVADDQPDILDAIRMVLRSAGFRADTVGSVREVLDRVGAERYDLLLMDLNYARDTTSGVEGLALLDRLRHDEPQLPVVVMTGWATVETAVEAMRRGARTFLSKPWDNAELTRVVRREIADAEMRRQQGGQESRQHEDARLIQRALLPASMPAIDGCDIAAVWHPALEFGGDCYDVQRLDDDRIAVAIADVAGKGLPAALVMANVQALARAYGAQDTCPAHVVASISRALCANSGLRRFVTMFYGVFDGRRGTFTFTNGGHNPPVLRRADGSVERLSAGGTVLGLFPDTGYEQAEVALHAGDRLVLFTDGITEAQRDDGQEFGDGRLIELVAAVPAATASQLTDAIVASVRAFTGGALADDATLIAINVGARRAPTRASFPPPQ